MWPHLVCDGSLITFWKRNSRPKVRRRNFGLGQQIESSLAFVYHRHDSVALLGRRSRGVVVLTVLTRNVENVFVPDGGDRAANEAKVAALTELGEVVDLPAALAPVNVDDDGTAINHLGRGAPAVTYTTAGGTALRVLTCHLKSKLLTFPGQHFDTHDESERVRYDLFALDRRAAEAAALRVWVTTCLAGDWAEKPRLVCGDLNDTMEAATTQVLFGPPRFLIGAGGFGRPDQGDRQRLWDVGYKMVPPNNYSRINAGRQEQIYQMLVSHALVGGPLDAAPIPLEVSSVGVPLAPRTDPPSDHRPVLARFDV